LSTPGNYLYFATNLSTYPEVERTKTECVESHDLISFSEIASRPFRQFQLSVCE